VSLSPSWRKECVDCCLRGPLSPSNYMPSLRSVLFYALPSLVALYGLVYFTYSTQTSSRKKRPSKKRPPPCAASTSVYSSAHPDGLVSSYIEPPPSAHKRRLSNTATVSRTEVCANMKEIETHFDAYEHLVHLPREKEALVMLRKAASAVKPLMRKRGWKIATLAEFLPEEPNLLGELILQHRPCIHPLSMYRPQHQPDREDTHPVTLSP
jgi:hypothetical protein